MTNALESNTWYCHAFCKIPKIELLYPIGEDEINGQLEKALIELSSKGKIVSDIYLQNQNNQNEMNSFISLKKMNKTKRQKNIS